MVAGTSSEPVIRNSSTKVAATTTVTARGACRSSASVKSASPAA